MKLFKNYTYFRKCDTVMGWVAFLFAAVVYLLTIEPTASLWDCAEFIATSYKLQIMHPPGSPLFMMLARFFTMFGSPESAGMLVNAMSALASAFTILFLFWSISHLGRRLYSKSAADLTQGQTWTIIGAALIGSVSYALTDTFWFSAVEAEVYSLSSLFTAVVVWAMFKWEEVADEPRANRWLILIAYLMGLSIGVHILNLLTIPALVFVYYFKKYPNVTWKGAFKATLVAAAILIAINSVIIPWTAAIGAWFDKGFVNGIGLPIHTGLIFWMLLLFAGIIFAVYYTHKKGKVALNTIALCFAVIIVGYSSYAAVIIRASANPPMNSNDPDNAYSLLYVLNRDQYGNKPLIYGAQYSAPVVDLKLSPRFFKGEADGKYHKAYQIDGYEFPPEFMELFPRMWSNKESHVEGYEEWGNVTGAKKMRYGNQTFEVPTSGNNLRYFFSYQLNFMYWRYFLWNFVGKQSDNQSYGEIVDGQWLSGINFIDELYLGPQKDLPSEMMDNKGRNTYFFLPFILGLIGLVFHLNRDPKNFTVVMWLFIMMGIALVLYFNTTPNEPRERDYVYSGSFYAFAVWLGLGVICVREWAAKLMKNDGKAPAVVAVAVCAAVPLLLGVQNWDDHDRSRRYVARDIGWNYLQSCLPNSIVMNYGDNDTFPLWYNQEVEGVRPDVRIMNTSYLLGGWYIDEMKYAYNESAPVPFSLPQSKYVYENEMLKVQDLFGRPVTVAQAIEFIRSDHPMTRGEFTEDIMVDIVPAKKLLLPVNKENAIASGIVKPEDAHLMVDTVEINISGSSIDRSQMMILDLLANFNWERPLYFTTPQQILDKLGLTDYLQFDGYAYRFVPIKTPRNDYSVGRIDVDLLYDNLMNVFRYGNVGDERVYADTFVKYNFYATQIWTSFARLAEALTERGEPERAVEVLDYAFRQLPVSQLGGNLHLLSAITAYYNAGAIEKGDELFEQYLTIVLEYVDYFTRLPQRYSGSLGPKRYENIYALMELSGIAEKYERERFDRIITEFIYGAEAAAEL